MNSEEIREEEVDAGDSVSKDEKPSVKRIIAELLVYAIMLCVCIFVVPKYVLQRTIVDGSSMLNTLHDEENLLVEKISYRFTDPDRYDIVVFYPYGREDKEDYYVKRIIGLPGETVQIIDSEVYINGNKLGETYGKDPITDPGIAEEPITLKEDEFFVLGDNREVSEDSRFFGPLEKKNLSGRVIFRIYPFEVFGPMFNK